MLVEISDVARILGLPLNDATQLLQRRGVMPIEAYRQEDIRRLFEDADIHRDSHPLASPIQVQSVETADSPRRNDAYERVLQLAKQRCPGTFHMRKEGKATYELSTSLNGYSVTTAIAIRSSRYHPEKDYYFFGLDSVTTKKKCQFAIFICASPDEVMGCPIGQIPVLVVPVTEIRSVAGDLSVSSDGNIKLLVRRRDDEFFLLTSDGRSNYRKWSDYLRAFSRIWTAPTTSGPALKIETADSTRSVVQTTVSQAARRVRFRFHVNKSFRNYDHHPITIPKQHYEELEKANLFEVDNAEVHTPSGVVMKGRIYGSRAGYGFYYQITIKGSDASDPLKKLEMGCWVEVEIARHNERVIIRLTRK